MIELMILSHGGHQSGYFVGFIIVFMLSLGFMPLFSTAMAGVLAVTIYLIYLIPLLTFDQISNLPVFINNNIFLLATASTAVWLESQGAVALRYCAADGDYDDATNPNGALHAIAGLVNPQGNVVGLMPHPERRVDPLLGGVDGRGLLRGLVEPA